MVRPRLVEEGKPLSPPSSSSGFDGDPSGVIMEEGSSSSMHNGDSSNHHPHTFIHQYGDTHAPYYAPSISYAQGRDTAPAAASANAPSQQSSTTTTSSSSSSSLLKALARTTAQTRQQPSSSHQSYRTVIGGCHRGEETQEPKPVPLSHAHHYAYHPVTHPTTSTAMMPASLQHHQHVPDPVPPYRVSNAPILSRPHTTHFEIGRMEEDEAEVGHSGTPVDDDDVVGDDIGLRYAREAYRAAPASPVRMEGVEDHSVPVPLVVLDGANVAYEYGGVLQAAREGTDGGGGASDSIRNKCGARESAATADARGMLVASEYFARHGVRVKVVLPASWFRRKPTAHDPNRSNARMHTDEQDALAELRSRNWLVASPPADDDDAYAIALARRESARSMQRCRALHQHHQLEDPSAFPIGRMGGAFVLSNDMFRDAQDRDPTLRFWLTVGEGSGGPSHGATSTLAQTASSGAACPGRISYTFVDVGTMDDRGDPQLDFLPNPRHPLVGWLEQRLRSQLL
jgi:Zc3h12a-like Ribonuclease NYN domain